MYGSHGFSMLTAGVAYNNYDSKCFSFSSDFLLYGSHGFSMLTVGVAYNDLKWVNVGSLVAAVHAA